MDSQMQTGHALRAELTTTLGVLVPMHGIGGMDRVVVEH